MRYYILWVLLALTSPVRASENLLIQVQTFTGIDIAQGKALASLFAVELSKQKGYTVVEGRAPYVFSGTVSPWGDKMILILKLYKEDTTEIISGTQQIFKSMDELSALIPALLEKTIVPQQTSPLQKSEKDKLNSSIDANMIAIVEEAPPVQEEQNTNIISNLTFIIPFLEEDASLVSKFASEFQKNGYDVQLYSEPSVQAMLLSNNVDISKPVEENTLRIIKEALDLDYILYAKPKIGTQNKFLSLYFFDSKTGKTTSEGAWAYLKVQDLYEYIPSLVEQLLGLKKIQAWDIVLKKYQDTLEGKLIAKLLQQGLDTQSSFGNTALLYISMYGYNDLAEILLKEKASPNISNKTGWTPVLWAAYRGNSILLRQLIDAGADINSRNRDGWTPLMAAAMNGKTDIVKILLDAKANLFLKDRVGRNALQWAEAKQYKTIAVLLKAAMQPATKP